MKIILINGPAGSGKDFAAGIIEETYGAIPCKFAAPLKLAAAAIYFGGMREAFDEFDKASLDIKNTPREEFLGLSCRQVQINISEEFLKPQHGERVFGKILKNYIIEMMDIGENLFVVSDSGFEPEAAELIETFGADKVHLIQLHREGYTFNGDSRNYIDLSHYGIEPIVITNNGDETFEDAIHNALEGIL